MKLSYTDHRYDKVYIYVTDCRRTKIFVDLHGIMGGEITLSCFSYIFKYPIASTSFRSGAMAPLDPQESFLFEGKTAPVKILLSGSMLYIHTPVHV